MSSIREAVCVLDNVENLEAAIDELESAGFDRAYLSLLASEQTVVEKLGHAYTRVEALEDDPAVLRTAFVSEEAIGAAEGGLIGGFLYVAGIAAFGAVVASGGAFAVALAAAGLAGGVGAVLGTELAQRVGEHHARHLENQLEKGGLLLWVRTPTPADEDKATAILSRHSAHDVHVHDLGHGPDRTLSYEEIEIVVHGNGECTAQGRTFASLIDAKVSIDQELRSA